MGFFASVFPESFSLDGKIYTMELELERATVATQYAILLGC